MSSENCYWEKIKAQRNPAEKPSKLRLFLIDAIQDLFIGLGLRYLLSI
jgi:hypothetical protein